MRTDSSIHWSAYPALLIAVLFGSGIALQRGVGGNVLLWGLGIAGGVGMFGAAQWQAERHIVTLAPLLRTLSIILVVVCLGGSRQAVYDAPSPRSLDSIADVETDQSVSLMGTIQSAPERSDSTTRFTLEVDSFRLARSFRAATSRVRVTLRPSPWTALSSPFPRLYQGQKVRLRGTLQTPPSQRNPGGFDYAAYLSRRGICCTLYVGTPDAVTVVSRSASVPTSLIVDVRRHVREQIGRYVPSERGRTVLRALLLGDRSGISDTQREQFARTGLMHLLAVSGLHVFLVGMVLYTLLQPLLGRFRLSWAAVEGGRALLTVTVLGGYMLLTGARPSVVRAVVMSALLIGGILLQRSAHPLNTLGVAALVLLSFRPPALFDAGFQLSMTAVSGIVTLHPRLRNWCPNSWTDGPSSNWLVSSITVSAAATIGTAPVLLYHFGWVSGAGLLLNVFAIPCTGLALSASVVLALLGDLWPLAGAAFGTAADFFVGGILLASREGAAWLGWAGLRVADPSLWGLGAMAAGIFSLAQWPRPRHRWRGIICVLLLAVGGVWTGVAEREAQPTLDVLFFDVGQGDAALVTTPAERRILVDAGPMSFSGPSAASFSILPYLRRRGIDYIDLVIVTHPDADHLGGLPAILQEVSVGRVLHSGQKVDTELFRRSRRLLQQKGIPTKAVQRGDSLSLGTSVRGRVLGPPAKPQERGIESENGRSVVIRLLFGKTAVLLPGDVESTAEEDLVRTYGSRLQSRIVKVPHHGSSSSSTRTFVTAVVGGKETDAVVSVGRSSRFDMPDSSVVSRWRSSGANVITTANRGAQWFRSNGRRTWAVTWR